jgi:hypothetical protein
VHGLGPAHQQRRDLRAVLAREQLGEQLLAHARLGLQRLHGEDEVAPGILAPGVVLVDAGVAADLAELVGDVAGPADVIHGRVRRRAEDVFVLVLLEDARGAAVEEDGEHLQLLGDRGDGEAAARGDVADDGIDVLALHEVAQLGDLGRGAAGFVDEDGLQLEAAHTLLVVGRRHLAGIDRLDQELGGVARRDAERPGGRPGQKGDDAELERPVLRERRRACPKERECCHPAGEHPAEPPQAVSSHLSLRKCFLVEGHDGPSCQIWQILCRRRARSRQSAKRGAGRRAGVVTADMRMSPRGTLSGAPRA